MPHCGLPTISTRPSASSVAVCQPRSSFSSGPATTVPSGLQIQVARRLSRGASSGWAGSNRDGLDLADGPAHDQHAAVLQGGRGKGLRPDRRRDDLECAGRRIPDLGPVDGRRGVERTAPTDDQHAPVVEQRRRMCEPRLREAARRRERPGGGIPELRRRDRRAIGPHAAGHEHAAVREPRGGVQVSSDRERACGLPRRAGPLAVTLGHDHRPGSVRGRGRGRGGGRGRVAARRWNHRRCRHDGDGRREWTRLGRRRRAGQQGQPGGARSQGDRRGQQRQAAEPTTPRRVDDRHVRDRQHRGAQRGRRRVLDARIAEVHPDAAFEIEVDVGVVHRVVPSRARPSMVSWRYRRA